MSSGKGTTSAADLEKNLPPQSKSDERKGVNGTAPAPGQASATSRPSGTPAGGGQHHRVDASGSSVKQLPPIATSLHGDAGSRPLEKHSSQEGFENSVFQSPIVRDPDPASERLARNTQPLQPADFRVLMGIREATATDELENPYKFATKGGLFRTIHSQCQKLHWRYRVFNIATYTLLAVQVVIGAIFIILGALRNAEIHVASSVLGAISTAVGGKKRTRAVCQVAAQPRYLGVDSVLTAIEYPTILSEMGHASLAFNLSTIFMDDLYLQLPGALALMKGQGLPNRLRVARNRLHNVVFEAEGLYWDFRSGKPILYSDIRKLREDYLRVMEEMRRNHPDTWTDAATDAAQPARKGK